MQELIEELDMLIEDEDIPKNVRLKIEGAKVALISDGDTSLKANKALQELDDVSDDPNIPSYVRPQIWNIVSQLETL